jgi:pimeloyl-ACP methyl ester carboxylesterase
VHAPTLRGLGDRAGELDRDLGVSAHVADVVATLDSLDGTPLILVGHSYAGVVVRGAAQSRPHQIRRLVLVDGWVVPPGESILSVCPPPVQESILGAAAAAGGDYVPPMPPAMLGLVRAADIEAVYPRLTPHPLAGFTERIQPTPAADALPCTAIICTANPEPTPFRDFAEAGRVAHGWTIIPIPTGHDAMITAPDRLADALMSCARDSEEASVAAQ